MWPVMAFYTNSAIHTIAHGSWAQVMMLAGGAELALVRGKLKSPYWRLATALAFAVSGAALLIHEQNPWLFQRSAFLHHLIGWWMLGCTAFAIGRAVKPRAAAWQSGLRVHVRRARRDALLRPRPGADLRPSLAARGSAAPMRRAAAIALLALAFPAAAFGHASLRGTTPAFKQRLEVSPAQIVLRFDQGVKAFPSSIQVLTRDGKRRLGAGAERLAPAARRRPGARAAGRRLHDPLARALGRQPHRVGCLHVRRARGGAERAERLRRVRPDPHRARRPLALLPRRCRC